MTRKKVISIGERRRLAREKALQSKRKQKTVVMGVPETTHAATPVETARSIIRNKKASSARRRAALLKSQEYKPTNVLSSQPAPIRSFLSYQDYKPSKTITVCHVIESLGLGGAQTMMLELINGLDTYYGENVKNILVCVHAKKQLGEKMLFQSYGVSPVWVSPGSFTEFLKDNNVNVVLHHRISGSRPLRDYMAKDMKYIIINHTWHNLQKMRDFIDCDYYVSVCDFLARHTSWREHIHPTRQIVILNGVENNYIDQLESNVPGLFKTGRCHRLIPTKFKTDYIPWLNKRIVNRHKGFTHHIIGSHRHVSELTKKYDWLHYYGPITNRQKKMSILKGLDAYYYETFQDEGASIAVLESLSCGVPVLAKELGGTGELLIHGTNGFLCRNREDFGHWLSTLMTNNQLLESTKKKTLRDFNERLHIRHVACKYMQLFESLL